MRSPELRSDGMTLPELLLTVAIMGVMALAGWGGTSRSLARMRVEAATWQLAAGLEQARSSAEASGQPCALALQAQGWVNADAADLDSDLGATGFAGELPPCALASTEPVQGVLLSHNLPGALRVSSNGLVLDGGTIVVAAPGTSLRRCLVVALPLGVVRSGRSTAPAGALPRSSDCVVDPSL